MSKDPIRLYFNGVPVWNVHIHNKLTGEKLVIPVPATDNMMAADKLVNIFGYDEMYRWIGTDPAYKEGMEETK